MSELWTGCLNLGHTEFYSELVQVLLLCRNPRIGVSHDGVSVWNLHISDVERTDEVDIIFLGAELLYESLCP